MFFGRKTFFPEFCWQFETFLSMKKMSTIVENIQDKLRGKKPDKKNWHSISGKQSVKVIL